jgi:iron complex outermembrane recepter protein
MKSIFKLATAPVAIGFALVAMPAFAQTAPADDTTADDANGPAIVVTGSRLASPNLESASPVTVVSAEEIKNTGTTRVEDLVNSLPQVFAGQGANYSNGSTGTATLNLRGLGSQRTLVLINGRRVVPGDPSSSSADINIIPGAMVKRIDVLTGGASAVYGADAVSGVVNFIMDTNFEGFKIDGQYSFYDHNNRNDTSYTQELNRRGFPYPSGHVAGGGTVDTTLSFGAGFDDGHGHVTAYAGYRKVNAILQSERDYSSCALTARSKAQNTADGRLFSCGGSATSANGTFFTNLATVQVGPNRTFIPGSTPFNFAPYNYFQRPDERYTAGVFADYEISPALHPYMEFMFMDDRTVAQIAPSGDFGNTFTINCDNPLLSAQQLSVVCQPANLLSTSDPFGGTGGVAHAFIDPTTGLPYFKGFLQPLRRNVEGGGRRDDRQHTSYRGLIGMKGDLGPVWNYDMYYQYGRTILAETYFNDFSVSRITKAIDVVNNPAGGAPICRSVLDGSDPNCVPWDIFGNGTVTQGALNYIQTPGFQRGLNTEQVASAALTGDLGGYGIKSPGAKDGVGIVLGAEYRKESLSLAVDSEFSSGDLAGQGGATLPVSGTFSVKEFFSELRIPLIQDSLFHDLTFTGGYRRSSYTVGNNKFSTDTYKLEGEFAPIADVRFRGGYNRAVRAPTLQDFFATQSVALDGSTDPCATGVAITAGNAACLAQGLTVGQIVQPNPAGQYNGLTGGNAGLVPEIADTWTAGVVLTPRFLPGFSFSADYFNIKIKNAIQGIGADTILANCTGPSTTFFCSLIHRDATGSLWRSPNGFVVDTTQNIGGASTRGIDFNAAYSHAIGNAGRMNVSFVGTWLDQLITDDGVSGKPQECAGLFGPVCGTPNPTWRHQLRVGFDSKVGIGASVRWRHFSSVKIDDPVTRTQPAIQRQPAVNYFDLALTARVGDHYKFSIGANNLLDKQPPLTANPACPAGPCNGNVWAQVYDSVGRYVFAGVTLDF